MERITSAFLVSLTRWDDIATDRCAGHEAIQRWSKQLKNFLEKNIVISSKEYASKGRSKNKSSKNKKLVAN